MPGSSGGIGTLLGLPTETILASGSASRSRFLSQLVQSRKEEISSWKAYAPAHAGKLAVEAVDRVMRGEGAPSPIYEGEDSVIAYMLSGKNGKYEVPFPEVGEENARFLKLTPKNTRRSINLKRWSLIWLAR